MASRADLQFPSLKRYGAGSGLQPSGCLSGGQTHIPLLQDLGTLQGVQARRARAAASAFLTGQYKYKTSIQMGSLYRKYHLTRHWGDNRVAARGGLRPGFSSRCWASEWEEGGEEGTEVVPVLPSKRDFTPPLPPKRPGSCFSQPDGAFPWRGWRDPMGAPVSLGWLGAGFGLEGGA